MPSNPILLLLALAFGLIVNAEAEQQPLGIVYAQQNAVPGSMFSSDPRNAAAQSSPAWHLDQKTCMPSVADNGNGGPNPGNAPDNCNVFQLNHNCPSPPPMNGQNSNPPAFPTYYVVTHCSNDNSWRILYDVYFTKDTGHRHDWEWAIVRYYDDGTGRDMWIRHGVWMEQDGSHPYTNWGDIESTYFDDSDINQYGQRNKDHPKLFFGKFHHPVFDNQEFNFPNTCPPDSINDYRSDDYRYESWSWLAPGSAINPSWNYGSADSTPGAFLPGGKYDICQKF